MKNVFLLLFLGLSFLFSGLCTVFPASEIEEFHEVETGRAGGRLLRAQIALPQKRPELPMPAVIWIHGGGWQGGSYKENPLKGLAAQGFFTISIEYRFSHEAKWPAQLEDCQQAVRWLRANAVTYGVDPKRIGVAGHSAGGHLAACLGTMGDGEGGQIQAVVDLAGPADFSTGKTVYGWAIGPLLDDKELKDTDQQRAASPLFAVKPGLPPFLIIHGDKDKVVPCEESVRFNEALKKAGVASELLVVTGGGHGFEAEPGGPAPQPDGPARNAALLAFFQRALK